MTPPFTLAELREAAAALRGVAARTPLIDAPGLTERCGVPVRLKCEQFQPIGAFKMRGAFTAVARLAPDARARGVVTHSSGNHGQALAAAARHFGVRAVIVMPERAPQIKVDGVRHHGGEIVFVQHPATERESRAAELVEREGLTLIPPYEHRDVILGQATCGLEIFEDAADTAVLLAPIGGGGLLAGLSAAALTIRPAAVVIGAEPEGAAKLSAALAAGEPARLEVSESIADGLLPRRVGDIPWTVIRQMVRTAVQVTDAEIADAVRFLYRTMGLRVEPSAAVPVAALRSGRMAPAGPVAAVLTGGNVDSGRFEEMVS